MTDRLILLGTKVRRHLHASHTLAEDVARLANMAGVKQLVLHHLVPADDADVTEDYWREAVRRTFAGPLHIRHDGLSIPVAP